MGRRKYGESSTLCLGDWIWIHIQFCVFAAHAFSKQHFHQYKWKKALKTKKTRCCLKVRRLKKQPRSALKNGFSLFIHSWKQQQSTSNNKRNVWFYCFLSFVLLWTNFNKTRSKQVKYGAVRRVKWDSSLKEEGNQKSRLSLQRLPLRCKVKWKENFSLHGIITDVGKKNHFFLFIWP